MFYRPIVNILLSVFVLFFVFFWVSSVSAIVAGGAKENCQNLSSGQKYAEFVFVFGPNSDEYIDTRNPEPSNQGITLCFEVENENDTKISLAVMDLQTDIINSSWATYDADREVYSCPDNWLDDQGGAFSDVYAGRLEIFLSRAEGTENCALRGTLTARTITKRYRYFVKLPDPQEIAHFYFNGFHTGQEPSDQDVNTSTNSGESNSNNNAAQNSTNSGDSGYSQQATNSGDSGSSLANNYQKPAGYNGILPDCAFDGTCNNLNQVLLVGVNAGKIVFQYVGALAFVMFVIGGLFMIVSFGNAERFKKGQQILVAAVIGMIISFSAFLLVNYILEALNVSDYFLQ